MNDHKLRLDLMEILLRYLEILYARMYYAPSTKQIVLAAYSLP
jgi:hypothetical protein